MNTGVDRGSTGVLGDSPAASDGGQITVGDLLEPTGVLDIPVGRILSDLGCPPFGEPGGGESADGHGAGTGEVHSAATGSASGDSLIPGLDEVSLPTLPALDPFALIKPITDLLGSFGSGDLAAIGADNPVSLLTGLSGLLDQGMSLGISALQALDGQWTGVGATGAITKAGAAATDSGLLSVQGATMAVDLQAAAGIVGAGLLELQGVIVKTAGQIAATMPVILTPPGQLAAVGFAAEGLAEALLVVAATRAQLLAPTAHVTAAGTPVPVTNAPAGGVSPFAIAAQLLSAVSPLVSAGASAAGSLLSSTLPAATTPYAAASMPTTVGYSSAGSVGGAPGGTVAGGASGGGSAGTSGRVVAAGYSGALGSPAPTAAPLSSAPAVTSVADSAAQVGVVRGSAAAVTPAGFMPMAGAAGLGRGSSAGVADARQPVSAIPIAVADSELPGPVLGEFDPPEVLDVELRLDPDLFDFAEPTGCGAET